MATAIAAGLNVTVAEQQEITRTERLVVVEHDPALRKVLRRLFEVEGYQVEILDTSALLFALMSNVPAAVILDLQSPGAAGCDLCRSIIQSVPGLPLLVLSASSDIVEKVLLLEMGADDYVTTPFSPRELLARTRALIRRAARIRSNSYYVFEDVRVDFSRTLVSRGGEKVDLTAKEFKTLEFLIKHAGRVITRDELLNEVWGYQSYPCTRTVDNHILRLRQKLESDPSTPAHLLTVHGSGYKFVP